MAHIGRHVVFECDWPPWVYESEIWQGVEWWWGEVVQCLRLFFYTQNIDIDIPEDGVFVAYIESR